ncbi:MAG TPA: RsmB/NOP family class I SAM-dependent RNA methyltransferase, partial [Pyrinomonadaceae bacterium]|nr:RsmB/NOP family class I SAM-dependent RNA methyltransferase [Pyrinomonadaceae bacterium]
LFVENCFLVSRMNESLRELAEKGEFYFQDEASQMTAQAVELKENESFFDVCAAPGSKTTLVAKQGSENARLIAAGDLYSHRIETLKSNCLKQGVENVRILQYDAERSLPFAEESFDAVLVDAPCSGTGTIRHNPEIRYFLQEGDFIALSDKQLRILRNASNLVKSGGRLVYSTCSLEKEENEAVIGRFLAGNEKFRKVEPNVPQKFLTSEGFARTFPQKDKMDGFFIATLERI